MKKIVSSLCVIALMVSCSSTDTVDLNTTSSEDISSNLASGNETDEELKRAAAKRKSDNEELERKKAASMTTMSFDVEEHDFGIIPKDTPVSKTFLVTNTGQNPLVISDAQASCGCTVPKKPEAPIAPGETGEIEVTFTSKPGQEGTAINKTVTITANIENSTKTLIIKGNVTK
jgi:hypothetical protein